MNLLEILQDLEAKAADQPDDLGSCRLGVVYLPLAELPRLLKDGRVVVISRAKLREIIAALKAKQP